MICPRCKKDKSYWTEMMPVTIRDEKGEIIRPRQTQAVCYECLGFENQPQRQNIFSNIRKSFQNRFKM